MANTLTEYADAVIMEALLTKSTSAINYEYIDDVLTTIRPYAFAGFTDLETLSLPNITVIPEGAFFDTTISVDLDLSWEHITSIGRMAFYDSDCITDSTVTLTACTAVGACAFNGAKLANIVFPAWTGTIANGTFNTAQGEFDEIASSRRGIFVDSTVQSISAPLLTSLPAYFCRGCTSLASVNLPLVNTATMQSFYGCTSLTEVSLPAATRIASEAFSGCTSLVTVVLASVTSMAGYAFSGCSALENFTAPSLTEISSSYWDNLRFVPPFDYWHM